MNIKKIINTINQELTKEILKHISQKQEVSIAFSGGIDSTTIAIKLIKLGLHPTLITIGSALSKDIIYAKRFAKEFDLPLIYISLTRANLKEIDGIIQILVLHTPQKIKNMATQVRFKYPGLSTYPNAMDAAIGLCFKHIALNAPTKIIFTGHGAGDLFAGTLRATFMQPTRLQNYLMLDSIASGQIDIVRDSLIVKIFANKTLVNPIFSPRLIKLARELPKELKLRKVGDKTIRKYIWTRYAKCLGVPEYIINRPPKSMQYSCGIYNWVMKYLKANPRLQTANNAVESYNR